MTNDKLFEDQVSSFHQEIIELIKKYQFRDRNQLTYSGISVSQCYILETLQRFDALTVNELANKMHLSISTITRVVEPLVKKGYIQREQDPADLRVRLLSLTQKGLLMFKKSWQNVFESEKIILANFPPEHRDMLVELLKKLNKAVSFWQSCCKKS
jgi:DNA-binding MarR family transcriptional regulator